MPQNGKSRVARTLYRQLLRWCKTTETAIPLSHFIDRGSIGPPQISSQWLEALADPTNTGELTSWARNSLPSSAVVRKGSISITARNSSDMLSMFKVFFRLNANDELASTKDTQERVSFAFQWLKSLNELTSSIDELKRQRELHLNRENVFFHVGQVVQHKAERWRGVIAGWDRPSDIDDDKRTSLTTKSYNDETKHVVYEVLVDIGDSHLNLGNSSFAVALQEDLVAVTDKSLTRIRNTMTSDNFERFDPTTKSFLLNDLLAYEYPLDGVNHVDEDGASATVAQHEAKVRDIAVNVTEEVKKLEAHLERCISNVSFNPEGQGMKILAKMQKRLLEQQNVSEKVMLDDQHQSASPMVEATSHLRHLLNIVLEVRDILWHRHLALDVNHKFPLGSIVYHKVFGFRGVVVAWDARPTVDVTRWDGLQHIDNPMEMPFYHVVPDPDDCRRVFGAERSMRYVCEENLEHCHSDKMNIRVNIDGDWKRQGNLGPFLAPDNVKFKHAEDIGDGGVTEAALTKIHDELARWQVTIRRTNTNDADTMNDRITTSLTLHDLYELLQAADKQEASTTIAEVIKEIWKGHESRALRFRLENGIAEVLRGRGEQAKLIFQSITTEQPEYVDAWNKLSACEFVLGNMPESLKAANHALQLEPKHLQALNGVGLILFNQERYELAAESFRKSLAIDTWSPLASKLSACLDLIKDGKSTGTEPSGDKE